MPIIDSEYRAPLYLKGGTLQTLIPALTAAPDIHYVREELILVDDDFIDLDWYRADRSDTLIVATHGLEGSSRSKYILEVCQSAHRANIDVLAWNCRSCSGRINHTNRLYHHGEIDDLDQVLSYVNTTNDYKRIYLLGFSMGGSIVIKWAALNGSRQIKNCVGVLAVSTPCDLQGSALMLDKIQNKWLHHYFKRKLLRKMRLKEAQFPGSFDFTRLSSARSWIDFDATFSAPYSGFDDVHEFYRQASANEYLHMIDIPIYMINASNDPILSSTCFPSEIAHSRPQFFLEITRQGGHVYFPSRDKHNYAVHRMISFIQHQT